jgi:hypothetical protein
MRRIEDLIGGALLAAAAFLMPLAAFEPVQADHAATHLASACDGAVAGLCERARA